MNCKMAPWETVAKSILATTRKREYFYHICNKQTNKQTKKERKKERKKRREKHSTDCPSAFFIFFSLFFLFLTNVLNTVDELVIKVKK